MILRRARLTPRTGTARGRSGAEALQRSTVVNWVDTEEREQAVHGLQRVAARERRIALSCVTSGIAWARAVATIKRSAGSP